METQMGPEAGAGVPERACGSGLEAEQQRA